MLSTVILRATVLALALATVWLDRRRGTDARWSRVLIDMLVAVNVALLLCLFVDHVGFPLHLDLMEGVVLQHVTRLAHGAWVYPEPTPEYVPLAYNPLYYVLSLPFAAVIGFRVPALRVVSVLATIGSGCLVFAAVRGRTGSRWWGAVAAGLFAASYRAMDCYLDTAHSDAAFLFAALFGTWLLDRRGGRTLDLLGVAVLSAAFWFKQHGALFALGGVLFLTWRDGPGRAWPAWLLAAALGPALYLLAGPALFGPEFHYFTWTVPRQWSELRPRSVARMIVVVGAHYPVLAPAAALGAWAALRRGRHPFDAWHAQFFAATTSLLMATLDPWNANNVYVPFETFCIVVGTMAVARLRVDRPSMRLHTARALLVLVSFAALAYDPRDVAVSPRGAVAYDDLLRVLRGLPGTVYAPNLGQLGDDFHLYPGAHWVALEDMVRGPGRDVQDQPLVRRLLAPALEPAGPAWILTSHLLASYPVVAFLEERYVLDTDFGERFAALAPTPRHTDHGYPRYLYRLRGSSTPAAIGPAP